MNTITTIISVMGLMIEGGAVGIGEKRHHQYTSFFYNKKTDREGEGGSTLTVSPFFLQLSQRTLQTVISWIIAKQGKGTVPSIREIQECLVKVGPQFFSMDFGSAMSI